jgi:hypothetical protein
MAVDPLFTRELPPTDGAIRYSNYIMKYLQTKDRNDFILVRVLEMLRGSWCRLSLSLAN